MDKYNAWWADGQTRRLNQAADELAGLHSQNASVEKQVMHLFELDRDQGHEIARLQAAVFVLMQMLAEKNLLDANEMNTRIQSAFAKLEADPSWKRMRGA